MKRIHLAVLALSALTASCAAFNPYIRQNSSVSAAGKGSCDILARPYPQEDHWLRYACETASRIERARSQIAGTRSTMTAALFPMAGIIGYNASRGSNAATNAALAAGGFAGYSATTTLAQASRLRVYDNGWDAIMCAVGKYELSMFEGAPESAGRTALRSEALRLRSVIAGHYNDPEADASSKAVLAGYLEATSAVELFLDTTSPRRKLGPSLRAFTLATVGRVNKQLTTSLPDNSQLAPDALSAFQSVGSTPDPDIEALRQVAGLSADPNDRNGFVSKSLSRDELDAIQLALDRLLKAYAALATSQQPATNLDIKDCEYQDATVSVDASVSRLLLGPNDAYAGKTVSVSRGTTFTTTVSGGIPPYTPTLAQSTGQDQFKPEIKSEQGLARLEIDLQAKKDEEGTYVVSVSDASGRYARWLTIKVPKNN